MDKIDTCEDLRLAIMEPGWFRRSFDPIGMTAAGFAAICGKSVDTVNRYRSGSLATPRPVAMKLARVIIALQEITKS